MRFAGLAEHEVWIRGGWGAEWRGQQRWRGTVVLPVPGRVMSVVGEGATGWYAKSGRLPPGETEVDLIHGAAHGGARQVFLRIGRCLSTGGRLNAARPLLIPEEFRCLTGHLVDWAAPDEAGPTIRLLVLAGEDVASRRCGVWAVRPRHRASVPPDWVPALARSRFGRPPLASG